MKSKKLTQREFYNYKGEYHVIDIPWIMKGEQEKHLEDIVRKHATGWYYALGGFYAFENKQDREIVKGAFAFEELAR